MSKTRSNKPLPASIGRKTRNNSPLATAAQNRPALSKSTPADEPASTRWTFLTNHSHVLILLSQDPSMVLREVAQRVGITERAVQRIIVDLEEGGFIEREKTGRRNHYTILSEQQLRHPIEAHRTIGDLIRLINQT